MSTPKLVVASGKFIKKDIEAFHNYNRKQDDNLGAGKGKSFPFYFLQPFSYILKLKCTTFVAL